MPSEGPFHRLIDRLRLLPVLAVAAAVLFGFKLEAVRQGVDAWRLGAAAIAGEAPRAEPAAAATAGPAKPAAATQRSTERRHFSEAEIEILQSLSRRREDLEERGRDLDTRAAVLAAAEKRLEEKIAELKALEQRIGGVVEKQDAERERQFRSLVKVYENMKPKDAARIFEDLQMDILQGVAERMKEQRIAPILAEMDAGKAKELTVRLATRGGGRSGG